MPRDVRRFAAATPVLLACPVVLGLAEAAHRSPRIRCAAAMCLPLAAHVCAPRERFLLSLIDCH